MNDHVTFRSERFANSDEGQAAADCATWMYKALVADDALKVGTAVEEEWGCSIPVRAQGLLAYIDLTVYGPKSDWWLVAINCDLASVKRALRMPVAGAIADVARAVERVLTAAPDVRDIAWHAGPGFMRQDRWQQQ
ncbi:MAG: hypothetical protein ACREJC_09360 [Tepidisphaeraceae bacterium]